MWQKKNAIIRQQLYSDSYLAHHGVMGMKWGIRRYQPYGQGYDPKNVGKYIGDRSAKSYKKALKSLQRDKDNLEAWGAKQQHFRDKYQYRANKAEAKGKTAKAQKYREKANPFEKDVDEIRTSRDRVESTIQSIIEDAGRNGIRVDVKNNPKFVSAMTAGERALQVLGFIGGGVYRAGAMVNSRKFKTRQMTDDEKAQSADKHAKMRQLFESDQEKNTPYDQLDDKGKKKRDAQESVNNLLSDGYEPTQYATVEKNVKTKDGRSVKISAATDSYAMDYPGQDKVAKKIEKSIDAIEKNAIKAWVDENADWLMKQDPNITKQRLLNGLELKVVGTNGVADLRSNSSLKELNWALPYVEFDIDTGKVLYTATDS